MAVKRIVEIDGFLVWYRFTHVDGLIPPLKQRIGMHVKDIQEKHFSAKQRKTLLALRAQYESNQALAALTKESTHGKANDDEGKRSNGPRRKR